MREITITPVSEACGIWTVAAAGQASVGAIGRIQRAGRGFFFRPNPSAIQADLSAVDDIPPVAECGGFSSLDEAGEYVRASINA